jgi:carbon storage regulator
VLVLSRKEQEQIVVGQDVVVTVVSIKGDKVRLGIQAPAGVPVFRKELLDVDHEALEEVPA